MNPAQSIGIYSRCGSLENGKWANVVLLNRDLSIRTVMFKGKIVK
ncbi:amidohydrolase family protein [uncultured Pseudoflavonifractor sp.]|nr:amidohydrolase family protein [uncultured Pseudoflavonifractor sp.]